MKKIFFIVLFMLICTVSYSQSIQDLFIDFPGIEIQNTEGVISILDKNIYSSSSEAMEAVNRILNILKEIEFSRIEYNNLKFVFQIDNTWMSRYFSREITLINRSRMLSSLVANTLDRYRTFNK